MAESVAFYIFGTLALVGALLIVFVKNPVSSAMSLVLTLFSTSALFLNLHAPFIAAIQVLVYAGAIMVLFLFVIMLLNLSPDELGKPKYAGWKLIGGLLGAAFLVSMVFVFLLSEIPGVKPFLDDSFGSVKTVGGLLFTTYVLPFELAGILLFVAIIGAVVLAKKDY